MEDCGTTTSDIWLVFNRRRKSKRHMNIKVYLGLGYRHPKTEIAESDNYMNIETLEEPWIYKKIDSRSVRAASQLFESTVNKFMTCLYKTPESQCYHMPHFEMIKYPL